jgi:hypothetical protein
MYPESCAVTVGLQRFEEYAKSGAANIPRHQRHLLLLTDCQSLLTALKPGPFNQREFIFARIWGLLVSLVKDHGYFVTLAHVHSHCDWTVHERIDEAAKTASRDLGVEMQPKWISDSVRYHSERLRGDMVKQEIKAAKTGHSKAFRLEVSHGPLNLKKISDLSRPDQRLFARICSNRVKEFTADDGKPRSCPWCNTQMSVAHALGCTNAHTALKKQFDKLRKITPKQLIDKAQLVVNFVKRLTAHEDFCGKEEE